MNEKYILVWNNGIYHAPNNGQNVFTLSEVRKIFTSFGIDIFHLGTELSDPEEEMNLDELIELLLEDEMIELSDSELVEMGDDFVTIHLCKLKE